MGLRLRVIYRKLVESKWFGLAYQGQRDKEVIGFVCK